MTFPLLENRLPKITAIKKILFIKITINGYNKERQFVTEKTSDLLNQWLPGQGAWLLSYDKIQKLERKVQHQGLMLQILSNEVLAWILSSQLHRAPQTSPKKVSSAEDFS